MGAPSNYSDPVIETIQMEAQIKEEVKDASLCFDTSQDNSASLSFVEKYGRYIRADHSDIDSDCDFLPDDTVLREEYHQLTSGNTSFPRIKNHRLSTGLPGKYRTARQTNRTYSEESIDVVTSNHKNNNNNGTLTMKGDEITINDPKTSRTREECAKIDELIEKLAEVRRTGPDGNSIFCTEEELEAIQERYGAILDYIHEKTAIFERTNNSKDSENEEQLDVGQAAPREQRECMQLLREKIQSVEQVRDNLNELRNQVKDQIEQLEIFERTKMENVG